MSSIFVALLTRAQLPTPVTEYRFHPTRRWRFDFAWPGPKLALEVQGGVWSRGKHGRGAGIVKDQEKGNAAACLGWRVLQVLPANLATMETVQMIRQSLRAPTD